ncbi:hypothetical protein [Methylocystis rosea]|uniref:hypothetical protein n=1 Tax=Methylocystis rosea TaxID=173366 RepID=UPI000476111E|nr:hypothetical protein [Methylocystis rosea]
MRIFLILISTLILSACATTIPVAVITHDGHILRGENTVSMASGTFSVSDGRLTCTGSYNPLNESRTITVTVTCNDGRTGIAIATRDTPMSGGGKVTLSDGSEGTFIFGDAARKI